MSAETIELGRKAIEKLDELLVVLNEAKRKGVFDIFADNAIFTWSKRKEIRKGDALAKEAKIAIEDFKRALDAEHIDLRTEDLFDDTMAIDYFLGAIGSWSVQRMINANIKEAERTRSAILHLINNLN